MAKTKDTNNPAAITALIQKLDPPLAEMVETIRQIILATDPEIGEQIKWNSPSFFYMGEMKPYDPKEYKRDMVVVNLHKGFPLLVFPTGAKVTDTSGLLEGDYTDGRRLVTFHHLEEIKSKETALREVVKAWLMLVDK